MSKCKHIKQKIGYVYCDRLHKQIYISDCKLCGYFKREPIKSNNYTINNKSGLKVVKNTLKSKSSKLAKLERDRFSLFTDNLDKCYLCGKPKEHIHEIYCGRNRANSMRYGECLPICGVCHSKYQNDTAFNNYWHIKGQKKFNEVYPNLKFGNIFKINYF